LMVILVASRVDASKNGHMNVQVRQIAATFDWR
jgi:hypothetical protein